MSSVNIYSKVETSVQLGCDGCKKGIEIKVPTLVGMFAVDVLLAEEHASGINVPFKIHEATTVEVNSINYPGATCTIVGNSSNVGVNDCQFECGDTAGFETNAKQVVKRLHELNVGQVTRSL